MVSDGQGWFWVIVHQQLVAPKPLLPCWNCNFQLGYISTVLPWYCWLLIRQCTISHPKLFLMKPMSFGGLGLLRSTQCWWWLAECIVHSHQLIHLFAQWQAGAVTNIWLCYSSACKIITTQFAGWYTGDTLNTLWFDLMQNLTADTCVFLILRNAQLRPHGGQHPFKLNLSMQ